MQDVLNALGLTQEQLQDRVIDNMTSRLLGEFVVGDEDADWRETPFARKLDKRIKETIEATVNALAENNVLPNVAAYIESLTLQKTNEWGEKKGEPVTFIEYLVSRAEHYMIEKVNFEGKAKSEANGYSWSGTQTRIAYMIHQHLHYSIDSAMKKAMNEANATIVGGLEATVKMKMKEIADTLSVSVKTK